MPRPEKYKNEIGSQPTLCKVHTTDTHVSLLASRAALAARDGRARNNTKKMLTGQKEEAHDFKVMFCRVCGFRVRVWESYRTARSFGYGYGSVTESTEIPGIAARAYRTHRSFGREQTVMYPYPG